MLGSSASEGDATQALRLTIKVLATCERPADLRVWKELLVYAPELAVMEAGEKIKNRMRRLARRAV
jgi:hypothetical protein